MTQPDEDVLREVFVQAGVDPDDLHQVLDQASVGLTLMLWRNSPVENWHAGRGETAFSDADMMRLNSHMTMQIRRRLNAWCRDLDVSTMDDLDDLDPGELESFVVPLYQWLIRPTRKLVTGGTLIDAAERALAAFHRESPDETPADLTPSAILGNYADHVDEYGGRWLDRADKVGVPLTVLSAGAFMGSLNSRWWGTRGWPDCVDALFRVLDRPDHEFWHRASRSSVPVPPAGAPDEATLRRLLLTAPWQLNDETADWLVNEVGIGYAIMADRWS